MLQRGTRVNVFMAGEFVGSGEIVNRVLRGIDGTRYTVRYDDGTEGIDISEMYVYPENDTPTHAWYGYDTTETAGCDCGDCYD